jgi:hypothetical protein
MGIYANNMLQGIITSECRGDIVKPKNLNLMYLVLNKSGKVYYEAISLEDAQNNCPPGYTIVSE